MNAFSAPNAIVVVRMRCPKCSRHMEIDCIHHCDTSHSEFNAFDCPTCGHHFLEPTPGSVVDVRSAAARVLKSITITTR
jgi:hypothetical protein